MASEDGPAIDLAHLGTYTDGDRALELELLTMFMPSAEGYIDDMAAAAGEAWWRAAHSLKGVAQGVGAWRLAELAEAAEGEQDAPAERREECVAALRDALEDVRMFVAGLS